MLSLATVLCSALLTRVAFAQAPTTNFSQADISSLTTQGGVGAQPVGTLNSWCIAQHGTCTTLCAGQTNANSCNATSLAYSCICSSNSSAPALAYYDGTIPAFECPALRGNCFQANANDLTAQQQCNVTYTCSSINASAPGVVAATSTSSSAAASATGSATGSASTPSSTPSKAAAVAMQVGEQYGVGILTAGLLAVMGLVM